jgi:predicted HNH restriction endonuclease
VFLNTDATKVVDGSQSALRITLSDDDLKEVIREDYPRDQMYSLGKYDRAHSPLMNGSRLDVSRAVSFLEDAARAFTDRKFVEGACGQVTINKRERDLNARNACIEHLGCRCTICNMSFEEVYGELGSGFIHVHHIEPLADGEREVDPRLDLVPVCPNCHAMLHRRTPPMSPQELARILLEQKRHRGGEGVT